VCPDGRRVFYDVGGEPGSSGQRLGGNLFVKLLGSSALPHEVLDCDGFDAAPWGLGLGTVCLDVDCGAPLPGSFLGNPRIVFNLVSSGTTMSNIMMATWNLATQQLEDFVALTTDQDLGGTGGNFNLHPAWCGSGHVVWSRYTTDSGPNEFTICRMQVDGSGPVPDSIVCHDTEVSDSLDGDLLDEFSEIHPSCGFFNGEWKIAYANARIVQGAGSPWHKICVIDLLDFEAAEACTDPLEPWMDQRMPTWSPDGTKIVFVSNELGEGTELDFDLWVMDFALPLSPEALGLDDTDLEFDPDWAPVPLGGP
jgi:hypothetical protein